MDYVSEENSSVADLEQDDSDSSACMYIDTRLAGRNARRRLFEPKTRRVHLRKTVTSTIHSKHSQSPPTRDFICILVLCSKREASAALYCMQLTPLSTFGAAPPPDCGARTRTRTQPHPRPPLTGRALNLRQRRRHSGTTTRARGAHSVFSCQHYFLLLSQYSATRLYFYILCSSFCRTLDCSTTRLDSTPPLTPLATTTMSTPPPAASDETTAVIKSVDSECRAHAGMVGWRIVALASIVHSIECCSLPLASSFPSLDTILLHTDTISPLPPPPARTNPQCPRKCSRTQSTRPRPRWHSTMSRRTSRCTARRSLTASTIRHGTVLLASSECPLGAAGRSSEDEGSSSDKKEQLLHDQPSCSLCPFSYSTLPSLFLRDP